MQGERKAMEQKRKNTKAGNHKTRNPGKRVPPGDTKAK